MGSLGWPEMILIALAVIVLFGARKLPEIGRGLGEGIRSFKTAIKGGDEPDHRKEGHGGSTPSGSGPN
jgi:sec-independent protein translocase protein TatA